MAERDAFGNEIGSGSTPIPGSPPPGVPTWSPPPATPSPVPDSTESASTASGLSAAPTFTAAPPRPGSSGLPPVSMSNRSASRSVGGGGGRGITTIVSVIVAIAIIGIPLKLALNTGKKAISSITNSLPFNAPTPSTSSPTSHTPTPSAPSRPPVGIAAGSLARPTALAKFVKSMYGKGQLVHLRVAPENLVAQTMTSSRQIRNIYVDYNGTSSTDTTASGGFGQQPVIPLSKIDPLGPTRMLKHINRPTKGINYLVLDYDFNNKLQWLAYYKNSQHFYSADVHGRHAHQLG